MKFSECHYPTDYVFLEQVTFVAQLMVSSEPRAHGNLESSEFSIVAQIRL